jgi:hypothetical protein
MMAAMLRCLPTAMLLALAACVATPMRWERAGTADATRDQAECRAAASQEATDQLPYGNGPPLYGFTSNVSMLQWRMAIDNERSYLEDDLTKACMRHRGFELMPAAPRQ